MQNLNALMYRFLCRSSAQPQQVNLPVERGGIGKLTVVGGLDVEVANRTTEGADPGKFVQMR